jgi:ABC-type phosphate transport system substrate-binding protein
MRHLYALIALWSSLGMSPAQADIAVIVHPANPVQSLTARQVAELYLGRVRTFETSQYAVIVDQGHDDRVRERFFKGISGMSLGQVTAYWARLKFTGQVQPPQALPGDASVLEFVRNTPSAIGYISQANAVDARVKTVLVLKE